MWLLGKMHDFQSRTEMDKSSKCCAFRCRYASFRVVHSGFNFCFQRDVVLRRYLFRRQSTIKNPPVLDQLSILIYFYSRNGSEMDRFRFSQIFHEFLDPSRFFNRLRKSKLYKP